MLCQDCPKKSKCTKLCDEAEAYADQDHISLEEKPVADLEFSEFGDLSEWTNKLLPKVKLSNREKETLTLLGKGLTRADVCKLLEITRENLRDIIRRLRLKLSRFSL